MAYGFMVATFFNVTLMKFSTSTRKLFLAITLAHVFGQVSVYRNMNFVFDQLYPLFREDALAMIRSGKVDNFGKKEMKQVIKALKD